ncbi:MAG: DUF3618 domain-containing protein [Rubrobacter sp.]|nr:DUF3618 domain-containing protein [Rubrobacter sp.]
MNREGQEPPRRLSQESARERTLKRDEANPDPASAGDELEEMRLELARTRAQMSETVEVLHGRLSSEYIKEQAREQLRSSARSSGSSFAGTVKRNSVPLALVGAGLGWLVVNARGSGEDQGSGRHQLAGSTYRDSRAHEYPRGPTGAGERQPPETEGSPVSGGAAQESQSSAEATRERASEMGGQAQERAQEAQKRAQEGAQRAKGGFQRMLQENPLALGAIAVGLGAAVGLSIPETEKENQAMGETRDKLKDQAQQKVQDTKEKAQRVAGEAQKAAKDEASNQDLTE